MEATIASEPDRCLERVRALFEATHETIVPHLGLVFADGEEFQAKNAKVFKALDFALDGHPESEKIGREIKQLVGCINGTVGALARLSNISGLRHGGSLDWATLGRQHAVMLGSLCDGLISFMFDVAWRRASAPNVNSDTGVYEDYAAFNDSLDDEYGEVEVAGSIFLPSKILFNLDPTLYEATRKEWEAGQVPDESSEHAEASRALDDDLASAAAPPEETPA
jgi:hypothetical protein